MTGKERNRSLQEIQKRIAEESGINMMFRQHSYPDPERKRRRAGKRRILTATGLVMLVVVAGRVILR